MRIDLAIGILLSIWLAACSTPSSPGGPRGPDGTPAPKATLASEQRRLAELFRGTPVEFEMQRDGSLRITVPLTFAFWPVQAARASAWGGFAYVTLFSMWLGFFAWYRGLALGGTVRVSQVQLVQPFLALLFAVPVLGERLEPVTMMFSLAVIATVFIGKKMPTHIKAAS